MNLYDPERHVAKHGEQYRKLFVAALRFLEERTPVWGFAQDDASVTRYIESILEGTKE